MCIKKIKQRFYLKKSPKKLSKTPINEEKVVKNTPDSDADWQRLSAFVKKTFSYLPETPIEEDFEDN